MTGGLIHSLWSVASASKVSTDQTVKMKQNVGRKIKQRIRIKNVLKAQNV